MKPNNPFVITFWRAASKARPFLHSFAAAPVLIMLIGVLLHSAFTVNTSQGQVIYGGPTEAVQTGTDVQGAAVVANDAVNLDVSGELATIPTPEGPLDSVSEGALFGAAVRTHIDGVQFHVVRPGETLYRIATEYGIDQQALVQANKTVGAVLIVGDELVIPNVPAKNVALAKRVAGQFLPEGFVWPVEGSLRVGPAHGPNVPDCLGVCARDLPDKIGTTVRAAGTGTVIEASEGWNGGYGTRVIIDHGGVLTLYGHFETLLVHEGEQVLQGQPIGLMGSTGHSTGSHVHFEVRWQPVVP